MNLNLNDESLSEQKEKELRQFIYIGYILQATFFLFLVTPIFGAIISYIKKDDLLNSRYRDHYLWQTRTFWYSILWSTLAIFSFFLFIGSIVHFFLAIWYIYRIVKGWIYLSDGKALYS